MLAAILFLLIGLALVIPGGDTLARQLINRSPVETTCAEYARGRQDALRLKLLDCEVDYLGAAYRQSGGAIQELFFPVRPAGAPRTDPVVLVAATRDPSVLAIAESGIGAGKHPDQEEFLVMMLKIVTALGAAREIEGMARAGILDRLRARRMLSSLSTPLMPGAVVVDLHASPNLAWPAFQTAAGLGLIAVSLILFQRDRRRSTPATSSVEPAASALESYPSESSSDATGPDASAAPSDAPVGVRGLLLLNVGANGGLEGIEHAAPLGPRDETIRRIRRVISGMQFDGRGRGMLRGGGFLVIVDVGLEDPTHSAIAGAEGALGVDAIQQLLAETGWRAYAPRTGKFWGSEISIKDSHPA